MDGWMVGDCFDRGIGIESNGMGRGSGSYMYTLLVFNRPFRFWDGVNILRAVAA